VAKEDISDPQHYYPGMTTETMKSDDFSGARSVTVRLIVFTVTLLALLVLLQKGAGLLAHSADGTSRTVVMFISELMVCAVMILAYRTTVRLLENRRVVELGLRRSGVLILEGIAIGSAIFVVVYAILWIAGVATYTGTGGGLGAVAAAGSAAAAAIGEEIVFRGAVFRILEEGAGTSVALAVSALLFGLLHVFNPGANLFSTLAIALEAGVLLCTAYALTRSLWFPMGLHFGWNFTEGGIFGAAVSGGQTHGLLSFRLQGASALTGGVFGPEASVVAVVVCLTVSGAFAWLTIRRGSWRQWVARPSTSRSSS